VYCSTHLLDLHRILILKSRKALAAFQKFHTNPGNVTTKRKKGTKINIIVPTLAIFKRFWQINLENQVSEEAIIYFGNSNFFIIL
jgi:hypothetical protein